jgi:hypothetical protein
MLVSILRRALPARRRRRWTTRDELAELLAREGIVVIRVGAIEQLIRARPAGGALLMPSTLLSAALILLISAALVVLTPAALRRPLLLTALSPLSPLSPLSALSTLSTAWSLLLTALTSARLLLLTTLTATLSRRGRLSRWLRQRNRHHRHRQKPAERHVQPSLRLHHVLPFAVSVRIRLLV